MIDLNIVNGGLPYTVDDIGSDGFSTAFIDDLFDQLGYGHIAEQADKPRQFNGDRRQADGPLAAVAFSSRTIRPLKDR